MKRLENVEFSISECTTELKQFEELLNNNDDLQEKRDILPFFKQRKQLSCFLASYLVGIEKGNKFAHEYPFFGDFSCDLISHNSTRDKYLLIEFEDATKNSIFQRNGNKDTLEWGNRFEHGYSQIIDWLWKLDDMKQTGDYRTKFSDSCEFYGMLIIGRDKYLEPKEIDRLNWRRQKVIVNSRQVFCLTYDEIFYILKNRMDFYRDLAG